MSIMMLLLIVPTCFAIVSCTLIDNRDGHVNLQVVFFQLKPFIYWNEERQQIDGIYPLMFRKGAAYCTNSPEIPNVDYTVDLGSREALDETMRSNVSHRQGRLANITQPNAVAWIPYDRNINKRGPSHFLRRNLTVLNLFSSNGLAVIQPRYRISLPNKIIRGMWYCDLVVVISIILSLLFGSFIWMIERYQNPVFNDRMGPITGIYWSFVTMTTVGYGDVVPVTLPGKVISVVWMFMGLMVAAVMTATLTNVVTGVEGIGIEGKNVAVVKESHEEYLVERDYRAKAVLYETYEDVLQAVRDEKVYAAVLPYDIAAWMQNKIRGTNQSSPLSIVFVLEGKVPFNILISRNPFEDSDQYFLCMFLTFKYEIVTRSEQLYKRHIVVENIYYGSVFEVFLNNMPVQIVSGITLGVLIAALAFYATHKPKTDAKYQKKKTIEEAISELSTLLKDYNYIHKNDQVTTFTKMKNLSEIS